MSWILAAATLAAWSASDAGIRGRRCCGRSRPGTCARCRGGGGGGWLRCGFGLRSQPMSALPVAGADHSLATKGSITNVVAALSTDCLNALLSMPLWRRRLFIALWHENRVQGMVSFNKPAAEALWRVCILFQFIPLTQMCQPNHKQPGNHRARSKLRRKKSQEISR